MTRATGGSADAEDIRARLVAWFENSESSTTNERTAAERDRDYVDGRQLTPEEEAALRARGQPALVLNHVRPKVNYLLGLEKRSRQDPKAYPRNPQDEKAAEAATDGIRYVCDENNFPEIASATWENMIVEGLGGSEIAVEDRYGEMCVVLRHIPWHRLFYDPFSAKSDFSDAKFVGSVAWMDEDDVLSRWPGASDAVEATYINSPGNSGDTFDDRPSVTAWADPKRKRIRVVQMWWREGGAWHVGTFTRGGWLEEPMQSPFQDEYGKPDCGLILQSAYVDRENRRYGVVRDMISPQDEINKRRSKALHLLSVRQIVAEQGAVQDVDAARREMAKPDGYVEVAPGFRFDVQQTADLAQGQTALLQEAKAELAAMGPNAAMVGRAGSSASGRAIALSQQGGAVEVDGAVLDQHRMWKRRVYRAIWNRIRQFWTAEKWVRVTDDERNVRFVGFNRQVTLADKLREMPPAEQQQIAQQLQLMPGDPRLEQVVDTENVPARMWVDIVVEEAPDVATLQQETFATLSEIAKGRPDVPFDLVIEAAPLRMDLKDKLLKRLRGKEAPNGGPPAPPPPPPEIVIAQAKMEADARGDAERIASQERIKAAELAQQREIEAARIDAEDRRFAARLENEKWIAATRAMSAPVSVA